MALKRITDLSAATLPLAGTEAIELDVSGVSKQCTTADITDKARAPVVQAVTSAATVTPAFGEDLVKITAQTTALSLANPSGTAIPGWGFVIRIKDSGTGQTISYGTQYRAIGVTLPATTVANKTLYLGGIWNADDTKLDVVAVGQEA